MRNLQQDVHFRCEKERNAVSLFQLEKRVVQGPHWLKYFSLHMSWFFLNGRRFEWGCSVRMWFLEHLFCMADWWNKCFSEVVEWFSVLVFVFCFVFFFSLASGIFFVPEPDLVYLFGKSVFISLMKLCSLSFNLHKLFVHAVAFGKESLRSVMGCIHNHLYFLLWDLFGFIWHPNLCIGTEVYS